MSKKTTPSKGKKPPAPQTATVNGKAIIVDTIKETPNGTT